ncbi:hypothetical protein HDE_09260 [Halotydeus destructor]|nr:hypothetical protein HDE_09260 [Halotydeus destructor]
MAIRCGVGHILFRGRHPTFTPEDKPFVVDKDLTPDVNFTFIDVIPGCVRPNEYHCFRELIAEANVWLAKNREWDVINCETVLLFFKASDNGSLHLAPEDTCFPLDGDAHNSLMGLRLWMARKDEGSPLEAAVLKYVEFTPRPDDDDDSTRFKKLDLVLERINREIREGKSDLLLGDVITIETLYYPADSSWKTEAECKVHLFPSRCISLIRIFYFEAKTPPETYPVIGIKDFVPKHISGGSLFKKPTFEPLSDVISRASSWLSHHPDADFRNAQCLEVKMKIMGRVDPKIMSHTADRGDYIRIFRVAYVTTAEYADQLKMEDKKSHDKSASHLAHQASTSGDHKPTIYMSSVIFTPAGPEATVQEIRRRIHEWVVQATRDVGSMLLEEGQDDLRPRLLSAETVEIFTKDFSEDEIRGETENTFKFNRIGTMNQFLYMAFRVYFDVGHHGRHLRSNSISSTISSAPARRRHQPDCIIN